MQNTAEFLYIQVYVRRIYWTVKNTAHSFDWRNLWNAAKKNNQQSFKWKYKFECKQMKLLFFAICEYRIQDLFDVPSPIQIFIAYYMKISIKKKIKENKLLWNMTIQER